MDKYKRVLVLGDSQSGKSSFIEGLFDESPNKEFPKVFPSELEFPKKTPGCTTHVHLLNEYYGELNDPNHARSASPSSVEKVPLSSIYSKPMLSQIQGTDYFLELFEVAGSLTEGLKVKGGKPKNGFDMGSG